MPVTEVVLDGIIVNSDPFDIPFGNAGSMIRLAGGGFMVLWSESTDNDGSGGCVQARIYDANGVPTGAQFIVNTTTTATQALPDIVQLANGNLMVVWQDASLLGGDASGSGIKGQILSPTGAKIGGEFLVNTVTAGNQSAPSIVLLANGNTMVLWTDGSGSDGNLAGIKGQILDPTGAKIGSEFLVNTETTGSQAGVQTGRLANGNVIVSWTDGSALGADNSGSGIKAQILDATGAKVGGEFLVNTQTLSTQSGSTLAVLVNGNFVIAWQDFGAVGGDTDGAAIRAQIFDPSGTKIGSEFLVNSTTAGSQSGPAITAMSNGSFVIAWRDANPLGQSLRAQAYTADGTRLGGEIMASSGDGVGRVVGSPTITDIGDNRFMVTGTQNNGGTQPLGLQGSIYVLLNQVAGATPGDDVLNGHAIEGDAIDGLGGNDTIHGLGGIDVINGGDGDDTLYGDDGNDKLYGDAGADTIYGGNGDDTIEGGDGNDTINGGAGFNTIYGGTGDDQISSTGGTATVYAGSGNDTVSITSGYIEGEDGDDTITLGSGFILGGNGNDRLTLLGGPNGGQVLGGAGADIIVVTQPNGGYVSGDEGDDDITVTGSYGVYSTVNGGSGSDIIRLSGGLYSVSGGWGADLIIPSAASGFITLSGFAAGEEGDRIDLSVFGANPFGPGGRLSITQAGSSLYIDDAVTGLRIVFEGTLIGNLSTYNLGVAAPAYAPVGVTIEGGFASNPTIDWQDYLMGADGNDTIHGYGGTDELYGSGGNDAIYGDLGADLMFGGSGDDTIYAEVGDISAAGGTGTDTIVFATSGTLTATLSGFEVLNLTGGASVAMTTAQLTTGFGSSGVFSGNGTLIVTIAPTDLELAFNTYTTTGITATINGSTSGEIIKGFNGIVQTINGDDGNDQVRGGNQGDTINGGNGDDKIAGAGGADILTGGAGADTFRYQSTNSSGLGAAADQITDFVIGTDRLAFQAIDADLVTPGDQVFSFLGTGAFSNTGVGQIRYQDSGANLLVQIDSDGNGVADMEIVLQGLVGQVLTSSDFLL